MQDGHPLKNMAFTNTTIASSAGGTAAATILGTVSSSYVRSWQVYNLTLRNLELIIGPDPGVANSGSVLFVPGTAASTTLGFGVRNPVALQQGMVLRARTIENTPITVSATLPLIINLWA